MDKYRIDSHKLIYHVSRVNDWLQGKNIYPIYMEISPTGACNHRCTYCGLDFMKYQPRYIDVEILKERLTELGQLGLKSIMYAGEGEPFLHPNLTLLVNHTKKSGIDVAITTNGVLMKKEIINDILNSVEWIKIGIDAAKKETFAKIHRCNPDDFDRIIENALYTAKIKRDNNYKCTIGMQLILLPENHQEVVSLAKLSKNIGMDYLIIKPYSQHPQSKTRRYSTIKYNNYLHLKDKLEKLNSDGFSVIFRIHTMKKWDEKEKKYSRCFALPFWSHIDSAGDVWGCSIYLNNRHFFYGNIYEQSFQEIWEGKKRQHSLDWVQQELDTSRCRVNCRMDEVNRYLWELKNTPEHANFI